MKIYSLKKFCFSAMMLSAALTASAAVEPVDYVSTLVGTESKYSLSTGNTYPAIAMPWGMNFWTPQTGANGDGWQYTYSADKIRGFKQTHQPSPWINDYGCFSIMPITGDIVFDQNKRASWFSHKAETARPYYYKVYLADYDIVVEMAPTERACMFRITYPDAEKAAVVVDAIRGKAAIKALSATKLVGFTTYNNGGVPDNFKNYFVIESNRQMSGAENSDAQESSENRSYESHKMAWKTSTKRGDQLVLKVASSFISDEQAEFNLKELDGLTFDEVVAKGRQRWNDVLGKIEVEDKNVDHLRTFYSCLYRSVLFPRSFYEINKEGKPVHYSPYNGKVLPGYMFTDTGFWDTFRCLFPFVNLVYPSMASKMQEGLVNDYK